MPPQLRRLQGCVRPDAVGRRRPDHYMRMSQPVEGALSSPRAGPGDHHEGGGTSSGVSPLLLLLARSREGGSCHYDRERTPAAVHRSARVSDLTKPRRSMSAPSTDTHQREFHVTVLGRTLEHLGVQMYK